MSSLSAKLRYSSTEIMGTMASVAKPMKNWKAMGNTRKKQNDAPAMKNSVEKNASGSMARFSSL